MIRKILTLLYRLINWLEAKEFNNDSENLKAAYNSLSPIDNADEDLHYTNALIWALRTRKENDIRNIALTGPYGSGKSSVLKTFQKRYNDNDLYFLNISLATFKEEANKNKKQPENDTNDEKEHSNSDDLIRLIELSVLQQIFYHAQDDEIPDSRFKKIKSVNRWNLQFRAIGIILFIISLLTIFKEKLPPYVIKTIKNQPFHQFWTILVSVLLLIGISYTLLYLKKRDAKNKFHFSIPIFLIALNAFLLIYIAFSFLKWYGIFKFSSFIGYNLEDLLNNISLIYIICFVIGATYLIVKK